MDFIEDGDRIGECGLEGSGEFLVLALERVCYTAGEKVTGDILLRVRNNYLDSCLRLQSSGEEHTSISLFSNPAQVHSQETKPIFTLNTSLPHSNPIPPGDYKFPFNFKLPAFIPSTFSYSGEDRNKNFIQSWISYSISVSFHTNNKQILRQSKKITVKNINSLEKPDSSIKLNVPIANCCFKSVGSTEFVLTIQELTQKEVDNEISFKIIPDNSLCSVSINRVVAEVWTEMQIICKENKYTVKRLLSRNDRSTWIRAFASAVFEKDFEYKAQVKGDGFNVSSNYLGLIQCEYFIEIYVYYDLRFKDVPVAFRLPFHVNPKSEYEKEESIISNDWNPKEENLIRLMVETCN